MGEVQVHDLELHNRGDRALPVQLRSSCGCAALEREELSLEPGERRRVRIEVRGDGGGGPLRKTVWVRSEGRDLATIPLEAEVRPYWLFDPPVLDFGEKVEGEEARARLRVRSVDGGLPEGFRARESDLVRDVELRREGDTMIVEASLAARRPGAHRAYLELECEHPRVPVVFVPTTVRLHPAWEVEPTRLLLDGRAGGEGLEASVTLRWRGPGEVPAPEVAVEGFDATAPSIEHELLSGEAGEWTLRVRAVGGGSGAWLGRLELRLGGPRPTRRSIPLSLRLEGP